jgi:hypothetical protein
MPDCISSSKISRSDDIFGNLQQQIAWFEAERPEIETAFGTDQWLTSMETEISRLMKYSVFNMFQNLFKIHACRLFNLIPEKSSIGFGFSVSYVGDKDQL